MKKSDLIPEIIVVFGLILLVPSMCLAFLISITSYASKYVFPIYSIIGIVLICCMIIPANILFIKFFVKAWRSLK
jgi:hypothetical protein